MVLEKCKENLRTHIFNNRAYVPAETKDIASIKTVKRWAREISDALAFMHKEGGCPSRSHIGEYLGMRE